MLRFIHVFRGITPRQTRAHRLDGGEPARDLVKLGRQVVQPCIDGLGDVIKPAGQLCLEVILRRYLVELGTDAASRPAGRKRCHRERMWDRYVKNAGGRASQRTGGHAGCWAGA